MGSVYRKNNIGAYPCYKNNPIEDTFSIHMVPFCFLIINCVT